MFSSKFLSLIPLSMLVVSAAPSFGQVNTDFRITKIEPQTIESPNFNGPRYDKRGPRAKQWLEVEVTFDWQPRLRDPKYADELTFNYFILLSNKSVQFPQGALLVGSVTHTSVPQEKDMHSVVYVSPRAIERLFDGKVPANAQQAVVDIGVTISQQGQIVASASWKGKGDWWPQYKQAPGFVLNKSETPFAPLAWDYYEAVKSKGPGL